MLDVYALIYLTVTSMSVFISVFFLLNLNALKAKSLLSLF